MGNLENVLSKLKEHYPVWSDDEAYDARYLLSRWGLHMEEPALGGTYVRQAIREAGLDPYEKIPFRPTLEDFLQLHVPLEEMYPTPPLMPYRNTAWAEPEEPTHYVIECTL